MSVDTRSLTASINSKYDGKFLEELSSTCLARTVRDLQDECKRTELENLIFENFLVLNEPSLIASMKATLEAAKKMHMDAAIRRTSSILLKPPSGTTVVTVGTITTAVSGLSSRTSVLHSAHSNERRKSATQSASPSNTQGRGPRVNISQKTDLVMREIESRQNSLIYFTKMSHKKMSKLKAELEESLIRQEEVNESNLNFQQEIVIGGVHKLTQKIPAEKFVR